MGGEQMADPASAEARKHQCMRCGEWFACPHGPACTAKDEVLPTFFDGRSLVNHCPPQPTWEWIRAYTLRRIEAHVATLTTERDVLRAALDAAVNRAERIHTIASRIGIDADAIVCVENDTRREKGLGLLDAE